MGLILGGGAICLIAAVVIFMLFFRTEELIGRVEGVQ